MKTFSYQWWGKTCKKITGEKENFKYLEISKVDNIKQPEIKKKKKEKKKNEEPKTFSRSNYNRNLSKEMNS